MLVGVVLRFFLHQKGILFLVWRYFLKAQISLTGLIFAYLVLIQKN